MSDRTMPRTKPPTGIYIAATAFFLAIGLCVANVLNFLRLLLLVPLFASCIYLLLPRVRAAFGNHAG